jgi:hypothetical protein
MFQVVVTAPRIAVAAWSRRPADLGERAKRFRFFLRDRGGKFSDVFDDVLADAGVQVLLSPPRRPAGGPDPAYLAPRRPPPAMMRVTAAV